MQPLQVSSVALGSPAPVHHDEVLVCFAFERTPISFQIIRYVRSFEATVAAIYEQLGKPKESYNKLQQLGVSATAGYVAGVFWQLSSS